MLTRVLQEAVCFIEAISENLGRKILCVVILSLGLSGFSLTCKILCFWHIFNHKGFFF